MIKIQPIRIIPFDIGYEINKNYLVAIKEFLCNLECRDIDIRENSRILNNEPVISCKIADLLYLVLFPDGIGEFIYKDKIAEYADLDSIDVTQILKERKTAHTQIISHTHSISPTIALYLSMLRSCVIETKRRFTSLASWENEGLSYVMSFYLFDCRFIPEPSNVTNKLYNLLYTDNYNSLGSMTEDIKQHHIDEILTNADTLSNTHVIASWANFIVFGCSTDSISEQFIHFQITIQHIWMYVYITDKHVDKMFHLVMDKTIKTKHLDSLHRNLLSMKFKANELGGITTSTMHERDFRILSILKSTSKVDSMISVIEQKCDLLGSRMSWIIDEKRFKSNRKVEVFLFISAVIATLAIMKDFSVTDLQKYWYFFLSSIVLAYFLFFHKQQ